MITRRWVVLIAFVAMIPLLIPARSATAQPPTVRGLLFYDPTCHNCEVVLTEVLPPLEQQHGAQLEIVRADVSTVPGFDLWSAAAKHYEVPAEKKGVPLLVIGGVALAGEDEIRAGLAGEIERGLAAGGVAIAPELGLTETDVAMWAAHSADPSAAEPQPDPVANVLALIILGGMVLSLIYVGVTIWRGTISLNGEPSPGGTARFLIPVLALAGMAVAGYLSYIKITGTSAICPIGHCDAVQHSPWAQLFGIPVAYLGLLSYAAVLALWLWGEIADQPRTRLAALGVFAMAVFGTLFSIYLTFLEPFVIKEVCVWCLVSAVLMTFILLTSARQLAVAKAGTTQR